MSADPPPRPLRRLWRKLALLVLSLAVVDQALQWTVLRDGLLLGIHVAPFDPPLFSDTQRRLLEQYEEQLADPGTFARRSLFDAHLGWCPRPGMRRRLRTYDWAGAREGLRALPEQRTAARRIALVGCSFTEGHEVEATESWAAQLEALAPDLELANLGVGGYGADQAYLRALRDALPLEPDEVWLGLYPSGVQRTTTHFSPLQLHWRARSVLFKPRLSLNGDGGLEVLPSPAQAPEDVPRLLSDQAALFAALATDHWVRRAPAAYAARGSRWQHHSGLARLAVTLLERGGRDPYASLRDEDSEVFQVHLALVRDLRRTLADSGRVLRVVILPDSRDVAEAGAAPPWMRLVAAIEAEGVPVLDASRTLALAGGAQASDLWQPEGHYSPRANRLVAEALHAAWLEE